MFDMLLAEGGSLPNQPYMIQYVMCPQIPCLPPGYNPASTTQPVGAYMWQHAKPWEIKSIKLDAHVCPAYSLEDMEAKVRARGRVHDILIFPLLTPTSLTNAGSVPVRAADIARAAV
jgi:hypothetical protein